jgi:hypothetical protein
VLEPIPVAILGGNPVVGRSLESLLGLAGYDVRFVEDPDPEGLARLLAGVQLVIFPPLSDGESHNALLSRVQDVPTVAGVPVLELVRDGDEDGDLRENVVLWPCTLESLDKRMKTALSLVE